MDGSTLRPSLPPASCRRRPPRRRRRAAPFAPALLSHLGLNLRPHRSQIRGGLLAWYDANHRVLPWRRNPHSTLGAEQLAAAAAAGQAPAPLDLPHNEFIYFVWVCEIMSQQVGANQELRDSRSSG